MLVRLDPAGGGGDRGLREAVGVERGEPGLPPAGQPPGGHGVAAHHHEAQGGRQGFGERVHPLVPDGAGEVEDGDPLALGQGAQVRGRRLARIGGQDHGRATRQGGEDLLGRHVEAERGELEHPVAGGQLVEAGHGVRPRGQGGAGHSHALGPARGAGGVEHVGQISGIGTLRLQPPGIRPGHVLQLQDGHAGRRQGRPERAPGHQQGGARVAQHPGQPFRGIGGVERQVRAARPQDAQQGGDGLRRAVEEDAHDRLRPHAQAPEVAGEGRRPGFQLGVGPGPAFCEDGGGFRGELRPARDPFLDGRGLGCLRPVPLQDQLAPLLLAQEGDLGDGAAGAGREAGQQALEVAQQAADRGRVEQVRAVLGRAGQALARGLHHHREIELGRGRRRLLQRRLEAHRRGPQLEDGRRGRALQGEQGLERRAVLPLSPQGFHQLHVGQVLVGVGAQGRLAHPGQQLREGRPAREVAAQHEGVDEEADEVRHLGPAAPGDRGAHPWLLLSGVAVEEGLEAGQQGHEQCGAVPLAQPLQLAREARRQGEALHGAPRGGHPRPGPVRGQAVPAGPAGQFPAPPVDLRVEHGAGEPAPLPGREVRVLEGQGRQGFSMVFSLTISLTIKGRQLTHDHPHGPAVRGDVVGEDQQRVVRRGDPQQQGAEEGARGEVDRPARFLRRDALALGPAQGLRQAAQIDDGQG